MKWYVARLITEAKVERTRHDPLCEESVHLIQARDIESAYRKALKLGKSLDHDYSNTRGKTVHWKFKGLSDLAEVDSKKLESGTEIYYIHHRGYKAQDLIVNRNQLSVFWNEATRHKKIGECLQKWRIPFFPDLSDCFSQRTNRSTASRGVHGEHS
ncbi:MAG: DUF4288 domain-containing protein [Candidatus Hydrogenedentes bacterium]|nr:DUF4288 domain-containing protein [Candidatus Hydrogenedentota bacterium]